MKEVIRKIIIVVLLGVIVYSGYNIVKIIADYSKGDNFYEETRQEFYVENETAQHNDEKNISAGTGEAEQIPLENQIDFEKLKAVNEDIEGWIRIEDTNIDYPVLKSKKSNDDYIHTSYDGKYSGFGSVFVDYRNSSDFEDKNTIIYAHNMKNGAMFNNITKYRKNDVASSHKIIRLLTKNGEEDYMVYSAYKTLANSQSYDYSFKDDNAFSEFVDMTNRNSIIDTGEKATAEDKIITLSTCTDTGRTANRFVVHAKLIK